MRPDFTPPQVGRDAAARAAPDFHSLHLDRPARVTGEANLVAWRNSRRALVSTTSDLARPMCRNKRVRSPRKKAASTVPLICAASASAIPRPRGGKAPPLRRPGASPRDPTRRGSATHQGDHCARCDHHISFTTETTCECSTLELTAESYFAEAEIASYRVRMDAAHRSDLAMLSLIHIS